MPLKVALQTIRNVSRREVLPPRALLNRILPIGDESYPLLQYVDEYGNTIFNGRQMRQFLKEWDLLMSRAESQDERESLLQIRRLAEECEEHPHLFLRFIGD